MEDRDERIRIAVALSLCKGIGPVRMVQIYKAFADQWERLPFVPTPELGLPARTEMELSRTGWNALLDKAETSLHKSFLSGIRVHWVEDRLFPERLGPDRLPDGPLVLYTKGDAQILRAPRTLGVVGTRKPSSYGLACTEIWVAGVELSNPVLVSGLAFGIDAEAHSSALHHSLKTIAVLAHGLHAVFPVAHREMASDVLDRGGCWLSELPFGIDPEPGTFPQRNRLIAGMSDAVVIPEAGANSGTLITARMALDYNKPVYAVPGRLGDPHSEGCLALLASHKATIAFRPGQLLEDLQWQLDPDRARAPALECVELVKAAIEVLRRRRKRKGPAVFRRDQLFPLCPDWSRNQILTALDALETSGQVLYDVVSDTYSANAAYSSKSSSAGASSVDSSSSSEESSSMSPSAGAAVGTVSKSSR
jgi:DNA processing protein